MRRTVVLAAVLVGTCPAVTHAQSNARGFFLGVHLNGSALRVEDEEREDGSGLGFEVGYGFNQRWAMFAQLDAASLEDRLDQDYTLAHLDVGARWAPGNVQSKWRPLVDASIGMRMATWLDVLPDPEGEGDIDAEMSGGIFSVGAGISYTATPQIVGELRLRVSGGRFTRFRLGDTTTELEDEEQLEANSSRINLGFKWYPRGARNIGR